MNPVTVRREVDEALAEMPEALRAALRERLVEPYAEMREGMVGSERVWIIAVLQDEGVAIGYSEDGYEKTGLKWGLLFLHRPYLGDFGCWYCSLTEVTEDSGYFEMPEQDAPAF